jgi:integrase
MHNKKPTSKEPVKRKVKDIPIFLEQPQRFYQELWTLVESVKWPYKVNVENLQHRDKALVCGLILSGCRVSELLRLRKIQFKVYENEIVLANVETMKHGKTRDRIILPLDGSLGKFTEVLGEWLEQVPEDAYVFPKAGLDGSFEWNSKLSRYRVHKVLKETVDRFPHWFRGVHESIMGKIVFKNDAWKLQRHMGLIRLESTGPYVENTLTKEDIARIHKL